MHSSRWQGHRYRNPIIRFSPIVSFSLVIYGMGLEAAFKCNGDLSSAISCNRVRAFRYPSVGF
jgi:hypothetical protein